MRWEQGTFALYCLNLWRLKSILAIHNYCESNNVDKARRNEACRILCLAAARYEVDVLERPLDDPIHRVDLSPFAWRTSYNIEDMAKAGKLADARCFVNIFYVYDEDDL